VKLSCQEQLIPGETLVGKWRTISEMGYSGIELQGRGEFAFEKRLPELREGLREGVVFSSVCVMMPHFIGAFDEDLRRDAIANMKSLLSVIAELGGRGAITPASYGMHSNRLPPFTPPRSPDEDEAVLIDGLQELGQHAEGEGVQVFLEPLNRYEDHMLNTVSQAVSLCEKTGCGSVVVMADLFHMNIEERDTPSALLDVKDRLGHIHLADNNRLEPGQGQTRFEPIKSALRDIGFDGFAALECGLSGEPIKALRRTAELLLD
jgi:sugar phosphate isomerase/epimerase